MTITIEYAVKQEIVNYNDTKQKGNDVENIKYPAYPYTAHVLLKDLRIILSKEQREQMTFERLSQMIGISKSTTHHWFEVFPHPHLLAYMCLLEFLSPEQRHAYIDKHCRVFPSFNHPWLAHAPASIALLGQVMNQSKGLTIISGGSESERTFLLTAMGHAYRRINRQGPTAAGIDMHRPIDFVPVDSFFYIDGTVNSQKIRQAVLILWPRILSSKANIVFFNGLWSSVPSLRQDIVRRAIDSNVIMAEAGIPDIAALKYVSPLRLLTISTPKRFPNRIRIHHKRLK
jgi:hypothetical protein